MRPIFTQIDSNELQTGFDHGLVDFYYACVDFDVGKEAMFGEKNVNPTFTMQHNSSRVGNYMDSFMMNLETFKWWICSHPATLYI